MILFLWIWFGLIVCTIIISALTYLQAQSDYDRIIISAIGGSFLGLLTLPIWIVPYALWYYGTAQDHNIPHPIIPLKSDKELSFTPPQSNLVFKPDIKSKAEVNSPQHMFETKFKCCRYIVEHQMVLPNIDDAKDLIGELTIWNGEEVIVVNVEKYTVEVKEIKTGARIEMLWDNLLGWQDALRIEPWKTKREIING